MISSNSKERKISYNQKLFIKTSLRQLGINPKNNGLLIFQEAITYTYSKDMIIINLEAIYKYIAQKHENKSPRTIETILRYAFYNLNSKKLSENYKKIFGLDFYIEYFNIKSLISDYLDILDNI